MKYLSLKTDTLGLDNVSMPLTGLDIECVDANRGSYEVWKYDTRTLDRYIYHNSRYL